MIGFGLISSAFDLLSFVLLLWLGGGDAALFRTGWLVESLLTEVLIIFVLRSQLPLLRSRQGRLLVVSTLAVTAVALLPYLPTVSGWFDLVPLPLPMLATMLGTCLLYLPTSVWARRWFLGPATQPPRRAA